MPFVQELVGMGMADTVGPSHYRLTDQGHALLGEIMKRNSERWRQWRENPSTDSGVSRADQRTTGTPSAQ